MAAAGTGTGSSHPAGTRCGGRGWGGPEVPSSPICRWRLCNPRCENSIWGFRGVPLASVTHPPGPSTGGNASGWIPASQPASSPHRAFHLGGLWPPWAVREEADVRGKDTRSTPKGQQPGRRQGTRSGALWSSPCRPGAGRSVWSVWPPPGTAAAGHRSTHWHRAKSARRFWQRRLGRGCRQEGRGWTWLPLKRRTRKRCNVCGSLFGFFLFEAAFLRFAWMSTSHMLPTWHPR